MHKLYKLIVDNATVIRKFYAAANATC